MNCCLIDEIIINIILIVISNDTKNIILKSSLPLSPCIFSIPSNRKTLNGLVRLTFLLCWAFLINIFPLREVLFFSFLREIFDLNDIFNYCNFCTGTWSLSDEGSDKESAILRTPAHKHKKYLH